MKALLINGSPRHNGNTSAALGELAATLSQHGIDTQTIHIGQQPVQGCVACAMCGRTGRCTFRDEPYYRILRALKDGIDAVVIASPVYYGGPNGSLCALLDRVFYSLAHLLRHKPAASIAVCRRSGATTTLARLNNYFQSASMPIASSSHLSVIHAHTTGQALQDSDGIDNLRQLAHELAWMMTSLKP